MAKYINLGDLILCWHMDNYAVLTTPVDSSQLIDRVSLEKQPPSLVLSDIYKNQENRISLVVDVIFEVTRFKLICKRVIANLNRLLTLELNCKAESPHITG